MLQLDKIDKKMSSYVHDLYIGCGEFIILPFAITFNSGYSVIAVALFISKGVLFWNSKGEEITK